MNVEAWFQKSASNAAIVYRCDNRGYVIITTAVDNLIITTAKQSTLDEIKENLKQIFKITDLDYIH